MRPPLSVALVWHMHQPWYRDDVAGRFVLPWVRRRAAKDYLHMLEVLERHPKVRVTMNMVPSLLAQLELYASGETADTDRELCLRPAAALAPAERDFLVVAAKRDQYGRRVELLAPYLELQRRLPDGDTAGVTVDDLRDLQLWTLLAWIDPDQIRADPALLALARRGRGFTEEDKRLVDERQLALLGAVIPSYRAAVTAGRVEAMTSPLHHPILPLLIDATSARVATPDVDLAVPPLRAPEDAREHLTRGLAAFARIAGHAATAMWPPECAVSPDAAELMAGCGVRVAVSDEHVLARTLGRDDVRSSTDLYAPHRDASGLTMVFRDAQLSNLVGFTYQSMPASAAVDDLLQRLSVIASSQPAGRPPGLVTIALDGENFKDFYAENATPFLDALYTGLSGRPDLVTTHLGAFLDAHPEAVRPLPGPLWTGSWIDADLRTWIGDEPHTRAWELLGDTRDRLLRVDAARAHSPAHDELLIAEASDWFWWFGEHHDSGSDATWDELFRTHLCNACALAGLAVPAELDEPVIRGLALGGDCPPLRAIDPARDGAAEWRSAGIAVVGAVVGAMQPASSTTSSTAAASAPTQLLYGAGNGRVHVRVGEGVPGFERATIEAGPAGQLVVEAPARTGSLLVAVDGVVDLSVTVEETARGVERVPASGTLRLAGAPDTRGARLRVVLVAAECAPVAVAGELAARVAATAEDAAALGHDVVVIVPHHRGTGFGLSPGVRLAELTAEVAGAAVTARAVQGALGESGVPVLSVDAPEYFDRDTIYGAADDGARYLAFCVLAGALIEATGFAPDVVHGFEWQSAGLLARLAVTATPPALVLTLGAAAVGYVADGADLTGAGVPGAAGRADLLDVGRRAATVVERAPRRGPLSALYERALAGQPRSQPDTAL